MQDAEVLRISKAPRIVDDEHYTRISVGKRWADVRLYLKDGRQYQSEPGTPRGDSDNPISKAEISRKFHFLADSAIGVTRANAIEQCCAVDTGEEFDLPLLMNLIFSAG